MLPFKRLRYLIWECRSSVPGHSFGLPSPQQQMLGPLQHTAMYNTGSGRKLCCSQEVVYHTQETVLKTRNATQSAPLSCPSCVSSKDHLLAAHESLREENRALLRWDTHDRSIQALDLMGLTHGAFCFYGGIASFFHVWEINFMKGLVVWVFLSSCYYLHLSWFFASSISANILSVNPKWEKPGRNKKWICFFLLLLIPESKEKSPQNFFFFFTLEEYSTKNLSYSILKEYSIKE